MEINFTLHDINYLDLGIIFYRSISFSNSRNPFECRVWMFARYAFGTVLYDLGIVVIGNSQQKCSIIKERIIKARLIEQFKKVQIEENVRNHFFLLQINNLNQ